MKDLLQSLKTIALALILGLGLNFAMAWTGPASAPPAGNTSAPVNVGAASQVKSGGLGVTNLVASTLCLGSNCITAWPSGLPTPPSCPTGQALNWNGSSFYCVTALDYLPGTTLGQCGPPSTLPSIYYGSNAEPGAAVWPATSCTWYMCYGCVNGGYGLGGTCDTSWSFRDLYVWPYGGAPITTGAVAVCYKNY